MGRCRPEFALGTTRSALDAHEAVSVGEAVLRVLMRIEAHLADHPDVTGEHVAMRSFMPQNVVTERDALVADRVDHALRVVRDNLADLMLGFAAEVAIDGCVVLHHTRPPSAMVSSPSPSLCRAVPTIGARMNERAIKIRIAVMGGSFPQAALGFRPMMDQASARSSDGMACPLGTALILRCNGFGKALK